MPPGYMDTKLTVTIGLLKVAMLNGAFNYKWEMIDSQDRLSNRSKDSYSGKHLIDAHDCALQPAFRPFVVERLHFPWRPFIRRAYDQGSIQ